MPAKTKSKTVHITPSPGRKTQRARSNATEPSYKQPESEHTRTPSPSPEPNLLVRARSRALVPTHRNQELGGPEEMPKPSPLPKGSPIKPRTVSESAPMVKTKAKANPKTTGATMSPSKTATKMSARSASTSSFKPMLTSSKIIAPTTTTRGVVIDAVSALPPTSCTPSPHAMRTRSQARVVSRACTPSKMVRFETENDELPVTTIREVRRLGKGGEAGLWLGEKEKRATRGTGNEKERPPTPAIKGTTSPSKRKAESKVEAADETAKRSRSSLRSKSSLPDMTEQAYAEALRDAHRAARQTRSSEILLPEQPANEFTFHHDEEDDGPAPTSVNTLGRTTTHSVITLANRPTTHISVGTKPIIEPEMEEPSFDRHISRWRSSNDIADLSHYSPASGSPDNNCAQQGAFDVPRGRYRRTSPSLDMRRQRAYRESPSGHFSLTTSSSRGTRSGMPSVTHPEYSPVAGLPNRSRLSSASIPEPMYSPVSGMPRRPNPMYSPNPPTATDTGQPDVWEVPHMQYLGFSEPILNVLPTSIHEPHSSPRPPPGPRSASTRVIETSEHHYFTHPWPHSPVCMASGSPAVHRAETVSTSGLLTEQDQAQHRATVEQGVAMMQAHHKATGDHFPDYMYDQMRDEFLATMNRAFRLAEQDVAARERGRRGHGVSPEGRVGRRDRSIVGRLHDIVAELFGARNAPW